MNKIQRMTPEQEAELPRFRQEYLDIACGGARADRALLHGAITEAYAEIGKSEPALFIFDSPAACMFAIKIFEMGKDGRFELGDQLRGQLRGQLSGQLSDQLGGQLGDQLRGQLWNQLRGQLGGQLGGQLWNQLRGQLGGQLGGQLWNQLWNQLGGQLWNQLRGQLRDQLGDQLEGQLSDQLRGQLRDQLEGQLSDQLRGQLRDQLWDQNIWNSNFLWGSQDLYWVAWGKFAEKIGVKLSSDQSRRLDIMGRIGRQCEWWWPFDNVVIASQRPTAVRWDDAQRLHCENGPAVEYADGYSLFSWHGTRLPAEWVLGRATIDPAEILRCENVEQRAAGLDCIGMKRVKDKLGRLVHDSGDPSMGALWDITIPGLPEPGRYLSAQCPRNGEIFEGVPMVSDIDGLPIDTALAAQAWRIGDPQSEYQHPMVRT